MDNYLNIRKSQKTFETAALVLSIVSIVGCMCFYISLPASSLAIIFALLSRGGDKHMSTTALVAFLLGIFGLVLSISIIAVSLIYFFTHFDSVEEFLQYYSRLSGIEYEELYRMIYGE